mgnify:FL=1
MIVILFIGLILVVGCDKEPKTVNIVVNYSIEEDCAISNQGTSCMEYTLFTYKGNEYRVNIGTYGWRSNFACNRYSSYYVDVPNCSCLYEAKILNITDKILNLTGEARTEACESLLEQKIGTDWWEKCYEKCREPTPKPSENFTKKYPHNVEITGIYHPQDRRLENYSVVGWSFKW